MVGMNRTGVLGGPSTARHPHALGDHETHATKAPAIDEQPGPGIQLPQGRAAVERGGVAKDGQPRTTMAKTKKTAREKKNTHRRHGAGADAVDALAIIAVEVAAGTKVAGGS